VVTRVDARMLGLAVVALGGGRRRAEDAVDPAVGLADVAGPGDAVGRDRPLAVVHARSPAAAERAAAAVREAVAVVEASPRPALPPVLQRIAGPPQAARRPTDTSG
jgi:thymidine phosphorylase